MIQHLTLYTAWGRCTPPPPRNFYNLKTTCALPMKYFSSTKKLVTNILKLKYLPQVISVMQKWSIFQGCQNLLTRIHSQNKDHGISWDLGCDINLELSQVSLLDKILLGA